MRIYRYLFLFVVGLMMDIALYACTTGFTSDVPEIAINPASGGPGTQVTIRGSGFPADTELKVRLGPPNVGATPHAYGHVLSGVQGEFVLSFTMPGQWPDSSPINEKELLVVIINNDGSIKAAAPFCFEPSDAAEPALSLTPGSGTPGEQVLVSGRYFRAGALLGLHLSVAETGVGNVKLAEVQVDGSGAFETTLMIPTTWPDSGAAITEQDLLITAVDERVGQTLASVSFFNFEGKATGMRLPVSEDSQPPGAELSPGPRLVIQRPDGSFHYVSLDGTSAFLAAASGRFRRRSCDRRRLAGRLVVYLSSWLGKARLLRCG